MPLLTLIAAVSDDGYISRDTGVPWDLPKDKAQFRAYTQGKWLLLGRKTYEEMLGWFRDHHPLILSRDERFLPFIGERVDNVPRALALADQAQQAELVVLGGGQTYAAAMPLADRLVITHVRDRLGHGVRFPAITADDWTVVQSETYPADDLHAQSFDIVTYQRIRHYRHAA